MYLSNEYPESEIVLVCDGCTDNTAQVARSIPLPPGSILRIIELPKNFGKGNAVKEGMLAGQGEYLIFTDADLSFAPEVIGQFVEKLEAGYQITIAQRKKVFYVCELFQAIIGIMFQIYHW